MIEAQLGGPAAKSYTIEHHQHGIVIRTAGGDGVPMIVLAHLTRSFASLGYDTPDPGIGAHLGAFVFVSEESGNAWRAEIDAQLAATEPDPVRRWARGWDVGVSSMALLAWLEPGDPVVQAKRRQLCDDRAPEDCTPHDDDDLGRCQRMLDAAGLGDDLQARSWALPAAWRPWTERLFTNTTPKGMR